MSRFTSLPETDDSHQEIEEKMKEAPFSEAEAVRFYLAAFVQKAGR